MNGIAGRLRELLTQLGVRDANSSVSIGRVLVPLVGRREVLEDGRTGWLETYTPHGVTHYRVLVA